MTGGTLETMSRLWEIVEEYRDSHGAPSYASIARTIGISSQGLSAWKQRGIKAPPSTETMRKLARLTGLDYETVVLRAALLDAGWIEEREAPGPNSNGMTRRYR
jgi:transcriptional regulator with XRE-family HTH domain